MNRTRVQLFTRAVYTQHAARSTQYLTNMEKLHLEIEGMSCEHCVRAVKNRLAATPGIEVEDVRVGAARLRYDPQRTNVDEIENLIADEGYTAFVAGG